MVLLLAALYGISQTLSKARTRNLGASFELPDILLFAVVGGAVSGIAGLYFFGFALKVSGRFLWGHASAVNIRAAMAWSAVPSIWALLLYVPELLILGKDTFTKSPNLMHDPSALFGFIRLVIGIWTVVTFCKAIGQVEGFSAWRGLGSLLLMALVITTTILVLVRTFIAILAIIV